MRKTWLAAGLRAWARVYEVTLFSVPIAELYREPRGWERTNNTIRPYEALGYLIALEFSLNSDPKERNPSVTSLLDEFSVWGDERM